MALEWVRLDTNIATNDKILALIGERKGQETAWTYVCSLAYTGLQETDGLIPRAALPFIHGTPADAANLVKHGLWEEHPKGWIVRNWADRQQTKAVTDTVRRKKSQGGKKGNCERWHGPECWQNDHCTNDETPSDKRSHMRVA